MRQKIKKILIKENGSITIFVLAAMLFMIIILALSFMGISNKKSSQISNIKQIEKEYNSKEDIGQIYEDTVEKFADIEEIAIIPSTTE